MFTNLKKKKKMKNGINLFFLVPVKKTISFLIKLLILFNAIDTLYEAKQ